MHFYIYILSNEKSKPLYIGVTNNLERRVYEHKHSINIDSYTAKYKLHKLLYWEETQDSIAAISREKLLKHWKYQWKVDLIKSSNPRLKDLSLHPGFLDPPSSEG